MSIKNKTLWSCQSCGFESPKWMGQCHQCQAWNSFCEQVTSTAIKQVSSKKPPSSRLWTLQDIAADPPKRLSTHMVEIDRLLGGGIVPGSLILLGGEPGIGKSTLLLQLCAKLCASNNNRVLYVSGEESIPQISLRATRLGIQTPGLLLVSETQCNAIAYHIEKERPTFVVIDSIQITHRDDIPSAPGSVTQVRECAAEFLHLAKSLNIPIALVGHVTKSGDIAGPRVLEHMVDTVLYFESDSEGGLRLIRSIKNRFGATDELAIFQMSSQGLEEITNPSSIFLKDNHRAHAGSVVAAAMEGSRALLVEVQALVTKSFYPQPTRRCNGFDPNRLAVLLAVMEKKVGLSLHTCDVFISIAGGLKIHDPAIDLAVASAIASSLTSRPIDPHTAVMGEIGLSGELRPPSRSSTRLKELAHMGFKRCICTGATQRETHGLNIQSFTTVKESLHALGCL